MAKPRTSNRDPEQLLGRLGPWMSEQIGIAREVRLTSHGGPSGAGLSSDTLLLDLEWDGDDGPVHRPVVVRLPPPDDAFPIFSTYDLDRQVEAMRLVRAASDAPVPEILWSSDDSSAIGAPFFVMERIDGIVPPDILPYTWGSWVTEVDESKLATMGADAVDAITSIHSVEPSTALVDAARRDGEGSTFLERHVAKIRAHFEWASLGRHYPTMERAFDLLSASMPVIDRPDALLWGDARIGNVLWRDARAVAILDWELTTVGPRELDIAWLIYFAEYFQTSAEARGHAGVPSLLRRADVVERYEATTGISLAPLDWFLALTALHQMVIGIRTTDRAIAFGEIPASAADEAALHPIGQLRSRLESLDTH